MTADRLSRGGLAQRVFGAALLRKDASAIADQALAAVSPFLVHVLLARWMTPAEYGAFALAYALYLVTLAIHSALLTEPLLIFGRSRFGDRFAAYWSAVVGGHAVLSLGLALLLAAAALTLRISGPQPLVTAMLAIAGATPLLLLLWLMRRLCYVRLRPGLAASASALSAVFTVVGLAAVNERGALSVATAIGCAAVASLSGSLWIWLRVDLGSVAIPRRAMLREALSRHWDYGRWTLLSHLAAWAPWNLHFLLLATALALPEIAGMRALYNTLLPPLHGMMALSAVSLPLLAEHRARRRSGSFRTMLRRLTRLYAAGSLAYLLVVLLFGQAMLRLLYGGSYASVYPLAPWVAAIPIPLSGIMLLALLHQSAGRSREVLRTYLPYVVLSLVLGTAGGFRFGAAGLVVGILTAAVLGLAISAFAQRQLWSRAENRRRGFAEAGGGYQAS